MFNALTDWIPVSQSLVNCRSDRQSIAKDIHEITRGKILVIWSHLSFAGVLNKHWAKTGKTLLESVLLHDVSHERSDGDIINLVRWTTNSSFVTEHRRRIAEVVRRGNELLE